MSSSALADRIEGLVHAETQVHEAGVDLTVASVARVREAGRIDFGGGELEAATREPIDPARRSPADDYGWWDLAEGRYLVTFNERLTGPEPVRIEPRRELAARGGSLPTVTTADLDPLALATPTGVGEGATLRVKENARIATARPV
ncbi:MAG: dCTP deaminase [Haloferacaceae archaeon]